MYFWQAAACSRRGGECDMAKRIAARLVHAVDTLFVVAAVALAVALLLPRVFGYTPYAVLSGSMEPELPVGSMVYVHETDPATLHPGDVVTLSLIHI